MTYSNSAFVTLNSNLSTATSNIIKANIARQSNVKDILGLCQNLAKDNKSSFGSNKLAKSHYINSLLNISKENKVNVDKYTRRAITIAYKIIVEGYKVKKEFLTLSQMEQITSFSVNTCNSHMTFDATYLDEVKATIKTAQVTITSKKFHKATAGTK